MAETSFETNRTRKKKVLRISYIFVGAMLFLTFFSNTINNFSLPRVSTEEPISGTLIKEVTASGVIQAKETLRIYSEQGRLVNVVNVKQGGKIKKGDVVVVLDKEEIEQQLTEEMLRYDQMKLNLEKLKDNESNNLAAEKTLETAKENLINKKSLYDAGAISGEEYKQAEDALVQAENSLEKEKKSQRDNERDIKIQQDSIQLEELTINKLQKELNDESNLVSPIDGIVIELNVTQGSLVNAGLPVFSIADASKGFEVKISVNREKAQYLAVGDTVDITVKSISNDTVAGTIKGIAESAQERGEMKDISVDVSASGITGGERCDIYINKKTRAYDVLVSNTAVGTDVKGMFVWILKERKGPLGSEFYVQKASITVDDSDSSKTAVLSGISPDESVVVSYSKNLSDGGRVIPDN